MYVLTPEVEVSSIEQLDTFNAAAWLARRLCGGGGGVSAAAARGLR